MDSNEIDELIHLYVRKLRDQPRGTMGSFKMMRSFILLTGQSSAELDADLQ